MRKYAARVAGAKAVYTFEHILGQSKALREAVRLARVAAQGDATTLLLGESGTGKELFAQAVHNAGARRKGPFVVVNCGALPRTLVQSELFGYVSGAFSGALKEGSPGKFELADGGTIFLDEIGEMPIEAQVSLLRLLLVNAGRVVTRAQILDHVWQYDFSGESAIIESFVSTLRRKVDAVEPKLIHTVRGVGYSVREP